jgi:hypothetical protein
MGRESSSLTFLLCVLMGAALGGFVYYGLMAITVPLGQIVDPSKEQLYFCISLVAGAFVTWCSHRFALNMRRDAGYEGLK